MPAKSIRIGPKEIKVQGRFVRIASLAAEQYDTLTDPGATIDALRESRNPPDLFTFVQGLPHTSPEHSFTMEWDNLAVIPVTTFEHWWTNQIDRKTRNMVRRAEKCGVIVREIPFDDDLVRGIAEIYNESSVRQGKAFWHYGKNEESVRRENGTFLDRSVFIGAFWEGNLIGFAKLVSDNDAVQAGLMQILSMIRHRDKAPTNALIAQAVRSCVQRGVPHLFYSKFSFGKKQRDSLLEFKQHNGFQRIDLPRYFVPLTRWGRFALRLHLHRNRLIDHVPESLQARLRELRDLWHLRRLRVRSN